MPATFSRGAAQWGVAQKGQIRGLLTGGLGSKSFDVKFKRRDSAAEGRPCSPGVARLGPKHRVEFVSRSSALRAHRPQLVTRQGLFTCNPSPLALVILRPEVRKLAWQLLGPSPEQVERSAHEIFTAPPKVDESQPKKKRVRNKAS